MAHESEHDPRPVGDYGHSVTVGPHALKALLGLPAAPQGLIVFAHGSGSGRFSPRNNQVAAALRQAGFATLLLDLLRPEEEADRANVFDIPLLAARLAEAVDWAHTVPALATLPIGLFGASTGAGAALVAAAQLDGGIHAVVSRGGRPDLAGAALHDVAAPTLLLVGGRDVPVIALNRAAMARMHCVRELVIVPGASHLFEEPGTLAEVTRHAIAWFGRHLAPGGETAAPPPPSGFADRRAAGRALAARLEHLRASDPLILALPRGGVPVAAEISRQLGAELEVLLVRKLGAPGHPEVGIGAVVDGKPPQLVLNEELVRRLAPPRHYVEAELQRQLAEMERRRQLYIGSRPVTPASGRTVIVVDDGIATGGTVRAALRGLAKAGAARLVLAVPVAPRQVLAGLRADCDEIVCLATPEPFHAVGAHYADFTQTPDDEVIRLLRESRERRLAAPAL